MSPILLVARRDYLAYVGAWGFWVSLITAPLLVLALLFGPLLLAQAEPPRVLAVLAERPSDAQIVTERFQQYARAAARLEIETYLSAAAPGVSEAALAAFDSAATRQAAIAAARETVRRDAPRAFANFPQPTPRYLVTPAPAETIDGLKPYLTGAASLPGGEGLFGVLRIRREANAPVVEYWSVNLGQNEPSNIAREAMRIAMQREALAARGIDAAEADRIRGFEAEVRQFDPRPAAAGAGQITMRERAPFYASLLLAFILWSVIFSVANMLLSGVIEEKSNKILDTLLTSVTPLEMLIGKLLGVAAVSATLFVFWGAVGGVLINTAAQQATESSITQIAIAFGDPRLLVAFGLGFVSGYLIYGAIFLALGALCESLQEAQTLLGPVALILSLPMMLVAPAFDNPNAPIIEAASWVPLFTPFLLLIRAPSGLSWSEIAGMSALMLVSIVVILWLAAQIFRAGVVNQMSLSAMFGRKKPAGE
ncbi:ABC transporter permease [Terricaulis sp.]|uniref:ABC transporter permease n=1 Tax=Terricaulis sp. TaxID=2768686 RepID=UPI0037847DB7